MELLINANFLQKVIPVKTGIQISKNFLDARFRGHDEI
jgi:hypothetical protein